MTAPARKPAAGRNPMLAKVHLGAKELGLADDVRRDLMARVTGGKRSASDCTDAELHKVLEEYRRLGWKPTTAGKSDKMSQFRGAGRKAASSPFARKARALWISLHQLGVVRDPSDKALEAFARRQLGVDKLQWADEGLGYRLVEALKAMAARAGWDQDLAGVKPERQVFMLKARLVQTQRALLGLPFLPLHGLTEKDLDQAAKDQAVLIHARKPAND